MTHLAATGVFQRCVRVPCREVTNDELATVHTSELIDAVVSRQGLPQGEVRAVPPMMG